MLSLLELTNYRNIRSGEQLHFDPLTVFAGPNGSGKTNVIRLLRFLQDAWTGNANGQRGLTPFEVAVDALGGGRILDRTLETPSYVGVGLCIRLQPGFVHGFRLYVDVRGADSVTVSHETMYRTKEGHSRGSQPQFQYYDAQPALNANYLTMNAGLHAEPGANLESIQAQYMQVYDIPPNDLAVRAFQRWIETNASASIRSWPFFDGKLQFDAYMSDWAIYDAAKVQTDAIRKTNPEIGPADRVLDASGSNLALVLYNQFRDSLDYEESVKRAMTELFPDTRSLRAVVIGRTAVTLEWHRHGVARPFYLDEMSEGTIRMLCWAAVLFSPNISRLIVLEEPEISIHPAWLRVLAGWIRDAARRTQIIVSTHSSDLLDYFTDDVASVRVFEPAADDSMHIRVRPLDPDLIGPKLAEGWKLGDLYRVGDPQVGGWPW